MNTEKLKLQTINLENEDVKKIAKKLSENFHWNGVCLSVKGFALFFLA